MANLKSAIKGTLDLLPKESSKPKEVPKESYKWQEIEKILLETAKNFGFFEIRTPVFEYTDLFLRSVGETTDVVNKEMYTFEDKGGRSITLRPEITAGVVRSFLENGLFNEPMPMRLCYLQSCYRYEKPQAGRFREFHQFGVEMFGSESFLADADVILLAKSLLHNVGVGEIELYINSIGCPSCRGEYQKVLKQYFNNKKENLCKTCLDRLERNPLRILDCKSDSCKEVGTTAPKMIEYLCADCKTHFDGVCDSLQSMGVSYKINPDIVRGLDYYTRTVFEFATTSIGAQGTVIGGGRYDGLVKELGGQETPGLGFAMGMERLMLLLAAQGKNFSPKSSPKLYIASIGEAAKREALKITNQLREKNVYAECDVMNRSVKASMKYADKLNSEYAVVLGDTELESGKVILKNMKDKSQKEAEINDLYNQLIKE